PFPGAVNMPGLQADTQATNSNFAIDGRDYDRNGNLTSNPMHLGIAVQPGNQQNLGISYEKNAEQAFDTSAKQNNVIGRNQNTGALTTGVNTIAPDATLNPDVMASFLKQVADNPITQILQSTRDCPIVMTGSGNPSQPNLTNGCAMNQTINLGTTSNP